LQSFLIYKNLRLFATVVICDSMMCREFVLNGCGCEARYGPAFVATTAEKACVERKTFFKTQPLNVLRNEQRNR